MYLNTSTAVVLGIATHGANMSTASTSLGYEWGIGLAVLSVVILLAFLIPTLIMIRKEYKEVEISVKITESIQVLLSGKRD